MAACDVTRIASGATAQRRAAKFLPYAEAAADRHGVSLPLVLAVIRVESNFNPTAVSSAGAVGLMQLMPSTGQAMLKALGLGVPYTPTNPELNIELGTYLLSRLLSRWGGDLTLALAAYNAGSGAVAKAVERGQLTGQMQSYARAVLNRLGTAQQACGAASYPVPASPWLPPASSGGGGSRPPTASPVTPEQSDPTALLLLALAALYFW